MEYALLVYLASIVDNVSNFFGGIAFFLVVGIALAIIFILINDNYGEAGRKSLKIVRNFGIVAAVCAAIAALIPDQKTIYAMAGAYAAQKIVDSPRAQEISGKALDAIEYNLDKISGK